MGFWELVDRHWIAASLLFLAALWVAAGIGLAFAKKRRPVTIVLESAPDSDAGDMISQAMAAAGKDQPS